MSTESMAYDNATYVARGAEAMGEAGGAAATQYTKFVAFTNMVAYSTSLTATVAGTAAGHGFSTIHISGTATTTLATTTLGTKAAGSYVNTALSTTSGGIVLAQGDILAALSLTDATGKAAVAFEVIPQPLSAVTQ